MWGESLIGGWKYFNIVLKNGNGLLLVWFFGEWFFGKRCLIGVWGEML